MKIFLSFIFTASLIFSLKANAQAKPAPPQQGRTVSEENAVYAGPSFDAKVVTTLPPGKVYSISNNIFAGAFYKIRVNSTTVGYIADSDIKPLNKKVDAKKSTAKKDQPEKNPVKKRRPFEFSRFVGFSYGLVQYEEDTMGSGRKEEMDFFGLKMSGADVILEGLIPTELNILYSPTAPEYYEKVTGVSASGWIFMMDFLLQTYLPQGKDSLLFFGFGPAFRFSKFDVGLKNSTTGAVTNYSMQDMALGAAFNGGFALRVSNIALRLEAKYIWEKKSYLGYGLALQFPF